jgi:hypothetical protein
MEGIRFVMGLEEESWLGYLQDYPEYWTKGATLDEMYEHLENLHQDLASGMLPTSP